MEIDFENIQCRSAFDMACGLPQVLDNNVPSALPSEPVRLIQLQDVLFLPHVLEPGTSISLVEERFVPLETVLDPFAVEFLKERRRGNPRYAEIYAGVVTPEHTAEVACILGNLFSRNFGHWTEELIKVAILEASGYPCVYVIPTLPAFAPAFLELLGVDESRIRVTDVPTRFRNAVFVSAINHSNVARFPAALELLRSRAFERIAEPQPRTSAGIWLERGAGVRNTGITLNRDEVYACLERYDIEVIDMAVLSLADQLGAMRGTRLIAGPHGAQFVHAQFMPPCSAVVECFSPVHVNPSILGICRALGHTYHQVVARSHMIAPYMHLRDCQVDIEHLELVLDRLLSRR
ncbi:MAG: glycosyltransferase family 61 protein [Ramlibacter sp.]